MDGFELLIDLHRHAARLGPGGKAETRLALELAKVDSTRPVDIIDMGCGTGAASLVLAKERDAHIVAVDLFQDFLDELMVKAKENDVAESIVPLCCSMADVPYGKAAFDVVWSEGAIYNMGFEAGIVAWHTLLKPGGMLVASEISWFTASRPQKLENYWIEAYPEIDTVSAKIALLEQHGYSLEGYFALPQHCWIDNYYGPLQNGFDDFLQRHEHSEAAKAIVEETQKEISLYEQYNAYYGYGMYVAKKM